MSAEPQRNALTDLIARFTADRDRLIAVVQDCETRVEELVARSRGQESPGGPAAAPAVASAELESIRAAMRELHDEIQVMKTREPNLAVQTAVSALATETTQTKVAIEELRALCTRTRNDVDRTATELRTAVEDVRASAHPADGAAAGSEAVWPRVEQALAPLSEATRTLGSRLAEVERGLLVLATPAAQTPGGETAAVSSDAAAELRAALAGVDRRAEERAEEVWRRVEQRTDDLWRRVEQLVQPFAAETAGLASRAKNADAATREQLTSTAGRLAGLAATVERLERSLLERPSTQSVAALESKAERSLNEQRQRLDGVASDTSRTSRTLVALTDRVARLEVIVALPQQSVLSSLYAEVRDALRTRANLITDGLPLPRGLWTWLARPAALFGFSRSANG